MDVAITRTKIMLPRRRSELLTRRRLLDLLYGLMDTRLILVAAPAGYGKTSLLIDFAHYVDLPVCWFALDALDRDPLRFIAHFVASLALRFPDFGGDSNAALQQSTQDKLNLDYLITTVVNDVYEHITEHFIIVLDDYHLVDENQEIDAFVSRFAQGVDENCHMMIASRTLLSLPDLSLMVARSQVGGLSFEELAFIPEEIQSLYLQNNHVTIDGRMAEELARQSEGWITGLLLSAQMTGQAMADRLRVAKVSGIGLYEYLAQQVLSQQPSDIQQFLLRTSLLDEFDGPFCREVIGKVLSLPDDYDWERMIDIVLRSNLFVLAVGEEHIWIRYHHLFRDFLRSHIERDFPEEAHLIQLRLAEVYRSREEWEKAYVLYDNLGQSSDQIELVEQAGIALIVGGRLLTLSQWLDKIPAAVMASRPILLSHQGSLTVMMGNTRTGLRILDQAILALRLTTELDTLARALVRRSVAYRLLGDYPHSLVDAEEALTLTGQNSSDPLVRAEAMRTKGIVCYQQGLLKDSLDWLTQSLSLYQRLNDGQNTSVLWLELGLVHTSLGEYAVAEMDYHKAHEFWGGKGNPVWMSNLLNNLGVLQHARGDYEKAAVTLEDAYQYARLGGYPRLEAFALTGIGDLYRELEAPREALSAYNQARPIAQRTGDGYLIFYLNLVEAVLARQQGNLAESARLLQMTRQICGENGSPYEESMLHLEWGWHKLAEDQPEEAFQHFKESLGCFEQEGHRVEVSRTLLGLGVARYAVGDSIHATEYLSRFFAQTMDLQDGYPLVASGREVRDELAGMQADGPVGLWIDDFVRKIDRFDRRIPSIRRHMRRKANTVPFAPPKIIIHALGKPQVTINDHVVTGSEWQTITARDLFFYILAHPEGLTKESVGEVFWPDSTPAELKLRFKNNIYRLRRAAGKEAITFDDEIYRFDRSLDYEYDVETFLRELDQARQTGDPEEKIIHTQAALQAYGGPYLSDAEGVWALDERERLQDLYLNSALTLAGIFVDRGQYADALPCCQLALEQDSCMESAHRLAMQSYHGIGNRAAVARQYENCRQALQREIGVEPSSQTQALYERLIRA